MNEKMKNQVAEMKKQTIGVEVEMNSITRQNAAKLAAEFFGTGRFQDTARRNGYRTWSAWDAQGREWKFQRDSSIDRYEGFPDFYYKAEMVLPIKGIRTGKVRRRNQIMANNNTRTMAFQIPEDLFQRIKAHLERETQRTGRKYTQREFVLGLIEEALNEAERLAAEESSQTTGEANDSPCEAADPEEEDLPPEKL